MKCYILLLAMCYSLFTRGQLPVYYVFVAKGDARYIHGTAKPLPVKQKLLLYKGDVLMLEKNSAVTLVNNEQQHLTLAQPGRFEITALQKSPHTTTRGITQKYLYLLWHELLDPDYDYSKLKSKNIAGSWGGVSRGTTCIRPVYPSLGMKTSEDIIIFKWRGQDTLRNYRLSVRALDGQELLQLPVKDTQVAVPIQNIAQDRKGRYEWIVLAVEIDCETEPMYFDLVDAKAEEQMVTSLVTVIQPAELTTHLEIIDGLERAGLVRAAGTYFNNLVMKVPGDTTLLKSYISFLLTYGFEEEARIQWERIAGK